MKQFSKNWPSARKKLRHSYRSWRSKPLQKRLRKLSKRPYFNKFLLVAGLTLLFFTTLFWAWQGAQVQQNNADQLVDARLFQDHSTLSQATFPSQHSFLIKWPLFFVVRLFGYSPHVYIWFTIIIAEATVAAFVFLLSRIERRPAVLGWISLMLSSVLLLVPPQAYAGALLPVNMAMLATRNLEYVVYFAALFYLIKAVRIKSWQFGFSTVALAVLVASDRLFLSVSAAGALIGLLVYIQRRRWQNVSLYARWLIASFLAGLIAFIILTVISQLHITNFDASQAGPYGIVQSVKAGIVGLFFAIAGVFTNFGANPAYAATTFSDWPRLFASHLFNISGPAYVVNTSILLGCLFAAIRTGVKNIAAKRPKVTAETLVQQYAMLLLWSAAASVILFVGTNHYYQVDARYLTLCLFSGFAALAAWLRPKRVDSEIIIITLPLLVLAIICGLFGAAKISNEQQHAFAALNQRNKLIAQTLAAHHVHTLVGDYWRVLPIQSLSKAHQQAVTPLENCRQPRIGLSSKVWRPDLHHTSFAYVITLDGSLTGYPHCDLKDVTTAYGTPNSSVLVAGTLAQPKELLLFYDQGIRSTVAVSEANAKQRSATVLPIDLSDITNTSCSTPTIMNIVAHLDDDILFMNPDLQHDISAGHCVRSIFVTAGDAGQGQPYWLSREQGAEAAYSAMAKTNTPWLQHIVHLPAGQFITIANPQGNHAISLIFMHLPDGNLNGQGFPATHRESLAQLEAGRQDELQTVDKQSSYNYDQLIAALSQLMHTYQPAEIRTQSSDNGQNQTLDHSDHIAVGNVVTKAYAQYEDQQYGGRVQIPLTYYMGYPLRQLPDNLTADDTDLKEKIFLAYAAFDGGVCHSHDDCQGNSVYGAYLSREYTQDH